MVENLTKAKINYKEGTIDLEGSEEFVSKYLNEFKEKLGEYQLKSSEQKDIFPKIDDKSKNKKTVAKNKGVNITPIPIDLKTFSPTLREFYNEKKPKSNQEKVALFVYYLNKNININNVLPGHILSCYKEIDERVPLNIPQLFKDIIHLKGWLQSAAESNSVKITISGDNFVKLDLPGDKNDKSNKKSTQK